MYQWHKSCIPYVDSCRVNLVSFCVILSQRQDTKNEPKEPVAKKRRRHTDGIPQGQASHQGEPRADSGVCLGALRGTTQI